MPMRFLRRPTVATLPPVEAGRCDDAERGGIETLLDANECCFGFGGEPPRSARLSQGPSRRVVTPTSQYSEGLDVLFFHNSTEKEAALGHPLAQELPSKPPRQGAGYAGTPPS